jgi:hypothetical protein
MKRPEEPAPASFCCSLLAGRGQWMVRGSSCTYFRAALISMSRFKTFGQKVGKVYSLLLNPPGKVLSNAGLNRRGQEDFGAGRNVVEASRTLAEVDLSRHVVAFCFGVPIAHSVSWYERASAGVALRGEIRRILAVAA